MTKPNKLKKSNDTQNMQKKQKKHQNAKSKHQKNTKLDDGWPESVEEQGLLLLVWRHHMTGQYPPTPADGKGERVREESLFEASSSSSSHQQQHQQHQQQAGSSRQQQAASSSRQQQAAARIVLS